MTESRLSQSGLSPEADQALEIITALCGGERWCEITGRDVNWIEVEAHSSDDGDLRHITIGIDGRVSYA